MSSANWAEVPGGRGLATRRLLHTWPFFFYLRQSCFHQCTRFLQDWSEDLLTIPLAVLSCGTWVKACFSVASAFFEEFPTSVWLNHLVPLSFHIRAGQLGHSWISRFYNTQLAPGKLAIVFVSWRRATEDSLYPVRRQPPGPVCILNPR